jgi:2-aminoadipate transaminase
MNRLFIQLSYLSLHIERSLSLFFSCDSPTRIIDIYKPRQKAMLDALNRFLPQGFTCAPSDGGMFLWVTGPRGFKALSLYDKAIENGVAFVPGQFFYTDPKEGLETMRLNYTMADEPTIEIAVEKLATAIHSMRR